MTTQDILNENTTKTAKIKQLLALGFSRTEITRMIAGHYQMKENYGFVQNIYAAMKTKVAAKKQSLIITDFAEKSKVPLFTGEQQASPTKIILLPY